jgi:hypothetical protein
MRSDDNGDAHERTDLLLLLSLLRLLNGRRTRPSPY